ncbi:unnamed protein product, partial [Laminaria digitata]
MEVSWPFSRPRRHQRHRKKPGVTRERPRSITKTGRIDSRRAIEKGQRRGICCKHHYRDHDHTDDGHHHHRDHRRQCVSSSTAFARTLSAIAVSLILLSFAATAATAAATTAAAAAGAGAATTAATATQPSARRSPSDDATTTASPASGRDHAVSMTAHETEPETETNPAAAAVAAASAELGATRASRKPPPLLHPSDSSQSPPESASRSTASFNRIGEGTLDSGHCCASTGGQSHEYEYDEYYDCAARGDE